MKRIIVILSAFALFIGQQSYGQKWNKTVPHTLYGVDNMHDTSNIQVGIGVAHPSSPLEVKGQIKADSIRVTKILGQGDSLIHLGHNSILVNYAVNTIQWSPTFAFQFCNGTPMTEDGLGIGNGNTFAFGMNSMALGTNVQIPICPVQAMVLGAGVSSINPLVNNIANSMYIGFNSTIPTVFVGPSSGAGTIGKVGIGTTSPLTALHVATVGAQPGYITSDPLAASGIGPLPNTDGLVIANNNGTMIQKLNFTGSTSDVLLGNGTFGSVTSALGCGPDGPWCTNGNTLTTPSDILGTLNNFDLKIVAGGLRRMVVKQNTGFIGIDPTGFAFVPGFALDVNNGDINVNTPAKGYRIGGNYVLWHDGNTSDLFVGVGAGGPTLPYSGNNNCVCVGFNAGFEAPSTANDNNVYVGANAGSNHSGGQHDNVMVGYNTGIHNTMAGHTFIGSLAGENTTNADFDTYVGYKSFQNSTTASADASLGFNSGHNNIDGNQDTYIGANAGQVNMHENGCTALGFSADFTVDNLINATAIGSNAHATATNTMILGDNSGYATWVGIGFNSSSPAPANSLEINARNQTTGAVIPCASGLRFTQLTSACTPVTNPGIGLLSVNTNGDVIYVQNNAANGFGYCPALTPLTGSAGYNLNNTANFYFAGNGAGTALNNVIIGNSCTYTPQAKLDVLQASGSTTGSTGIYVENDDLANTTPTPPIGIKAKMPPVSYSNTGYTVAGWFEAPWPLNVPNTVSYSIFVPPASTASPPHYQGIVSVGLALGSHPGSADLIQLAGDGYATGTWFSASDRRYKNNFIPLTNALQKIDSINPVYFYFDTVAYPNMSFSSKKQVGFIAQNVDSVLPEVVNPSDSGYSLDYPKMTVLLLAGMKQQQQTIDSLRTTLNSIEACISSLCDDTGSHHHHDDRMLGGNNGNTQNVTLSNAAILYQNMPNPFGTGGAKINYYLPQGTTGASVVFFDQYGNKLSQVQLTQTGMSSINVNPNRLSNGIYTYSLLINGTVNDTKKMMFAK